MRTSTCHGRVITTLVGCTALVLAATGTAQAGHHRTDTARQTLAAQDGWASEGVGTTGGSAADADHVFTVTTWAEFKAALAAAAGAPSIIKVKGVIDATSEGCAAFEAPGYDFDQYLADYDPAVWGLENELTGEQEELRAASADNQKLGIMAFVPANTTIVGVGENAGIRGGSLQIKGVQNVILRNLTIEAPLDCFPAWDPTDGPTGAWNSEYDAVVVYGSQHVWVDHNTLTDGRYPDSTLPSYFGEIYQQHDGLLDIVRGADLVTASWNVLRDHDKTLMIGNSDSAGADDRGKLRVTLHHNHFDGVVERAPRVRFGKVDAYNNHFTVTPGQKYGYSFGIGIESQLVAEKNSFSLPSTVQAGAVLKKWKEAPLTATGNYVNGAPTDLISVHNAQYPAEQLASGAGWTPELRTKVNDPRALPGLVTGKAGAGKVC